MLRISNRGLRGHTSTEDLVFLTRAATQAVQKAATEAGKKLGGWCVQSSPPPGFSDEKKQNLWKLRLRTR